jgi:hypothetical protein
LFDFLVSIFEGLIYLLAVGSVVGDTCGDDTFEVTLVATLVGLAVGEWVGVVAIHTRIATAEATRVGDGATGLRFLTAGVTAVAVAHHLIRVGAVVAPLLTAVRALAEVIGAALLTPSASAVAVAITAVVTRLYFIVGISAPPDSESAGATIRRRVPVCLGLGVIATTPVDGSLTVCAVAVLVLNVNPSCALDIIGQLSELSVEVLDEVATVEVLLELIEGKCDGERHIV